MTNTATDLWNGAGDTISDGQQQEILDRYLNFERVMTALQISIRHLQSIRQQFVDFANKSQVDDVGWLRQRLLELEARVTAEAAGPSTRGNAAKMFPGGIAWALRGKELREQNALMDRALASTTQLRNQIKDLFSYFEQAYTAVFDDLLRSGAGLREQALGALRQQVASILAEYKAISARSDGDTPSLEAAFNQIDDRWRSTINTLTVEMLQRSAAKREVDRRSAVASRLREAGVDPSTIEKVTVSGDS